MIRQALGTVAVLAAAAILVSPAPGHADATRLRIYAAASLTEVFQRLDPAQSYSFAGSNTLETQIRNGAPADVFASAAPLNAERLYRERLVEKPVAFTANRLTLIVPRSNPADLHSVYDLARKPVKLVVAARAVPVGAYTRAVLRRMGLLAVLSKVVSEEPDAKAVAGKVALGEADAGFVYVTDARPVKDAVAGIRIPVWAQPRVRYEVAVVSRSGRKPAARAWVRMLLGKRGQNALEAAGFLPLPKKGSQ
jgi:molybdate transport system substrate-binding protein